MSDIKGALQRKLGPLPVWAWALITGVGLYLYRARQAVGTAADQSSGGATGSDTTVSSTPPQDPVTLQPGESVYDPNSGQLLGTGPDQQIPDQQTPDTPIPLDPILVDPGQSIYDPNTGRMLGIPPTRKAKPKPKVGKRKPKPKTHSRRTRSVKRTTHKTVKSRTQAVTRTITGRAKSGGRSASPKARVRGQTNAAVPKSRARVKTVRLPAVRQRPAAPRVVNHQTQQVVAHEAARPAPRPAPKPAPKPRRRK